MESTRSLFLKHVGQTSDDPVMLEIEKAEGIYLYTTEGKKIIDLIAGVSVSNIGHLHPKVVAAVKKQAETFMHLMVYGEYVQAPQVKYAQKLTSLLPKKYDSVYFTNSGSEANEAALKLAKRYTGRAEMVSFKNAYHGSTHGALSVLGDEYFKQSFRPLLPGIKFIEFNQAEQLNTITEKTACVIVEPVQGEAGIVLPQKNYLQKLRERCNETGTLLIFDEVQTGFGRTGSLFGFMNFNVQPDIFTIAKGMGGGMPIGALVANKQVMDSFQTNPVLGHITTFGGHPVSVAAALATLEVLIDEEIIEKVNQKGLLFKKLLNHPKIKSVHGIGLFYAVELESYEQVRAFISAAVEIGLVTDWFIFNDMHFRIAPPLTITEAEIHEAVNIIHKALDKI